MHIGQTGPNFEQGLRDAWDILRRPDYSSNFYSKRILPEYDSNRSVVPWASLDQLRALPRS